MEYDYFDINSWQNWADNSKHMFRGIAEGGKIGFLLDEFDDLMILLTVGVDNISVSVINNLTDVELDASYADIVFTISPSDVEDILEDYDFEIFNELLEKQYIHLYNLIDFEALDYNGYEHFLSRLGFYIDGCYYCGL
ncbi:MAG: hypothetical protein ACI4VU_03915 [Methanobrevibacter sp.]